MYLKDLMQGEQFAFYSIVMKMVYVDGAFSGEEQDLVKGFLDEMGLEKAQIRDIPFEDAVDMFSYSSPAARRKVFVELVGVALCDEVFHVNEQALLDNIANRFGITENEKNAIVQTVRDLLGIYKKLQDFVYGKP